MASIREVRKKLIPVLIGLTVLVLACVGYLLSPSGRTQQSRQRDLDALRVQLSAKRQEVLPARGMDGKLKEASTEISDFYKARFPEQYSTVSDEIGKLAAANGVQIANVKYDDKEAPVEGLRQLNIEIALSGSYLSEVKFINALERDNLFFVVDGVALGEQQGNVRLQLKVETYLRAGAATS
jgi:type IV pilus assembly protein PilO